MEETRETAIHQFAFEQNLTYQEAEARFDTMIETLRRAFAKIVAATQELCKRIKPLLRVFVAVNQAYNSRQKKMFFRKKRSQKKNWKKWKKWKKGMKG